MSAASAAAMAPSKTPGRGPSLKNVQRKARTRPNRVILYAVEGYGKTSLACQFPEPVVLMSKGEDGLRKLLANGLVPETAHFDDEASNWNEALMALGELVVNNGGGFKTLVVDTLNGMARLCIDHVTNTQFNGSAEQFNSFGRGYKPAAAEWEKLKDKLTSLNEKGMTILLLAHADVKSFKNPEGTDYDRYTARMPHATMWEPMQEWADMILFGQLETFVKADDPKAKKGKALGGQNRLLYCQKTAVADAKNRHNLPAVISCGIGAENAFAALAKAIRDGREAAQVPAQGESEPAPAGDEPATSQADAPTPDAA